MMLPYEPYGLQLEASRAVVRPVAGQAEQHHVSNRTPVHENGGQRTANKPSKRLVKGCNGASGHAAAGEREALGSERLGRPPCACTAYRAPVLPGVLLDGLIIPFYAVQGGEGDDFV